MVALINKTDQYHQKALTLASKYDTFAVVTTDAILLEIGNALSRIARKEAGIESEQVKLAIIMAKTVIKLLKLIPPLIPPLLKAGLFHSIKMGSSQSLCPSHLRPSVIDKKPNNLKRLRQMVFKTEKLTAD